MGRKLASSGVKRRRSAFLDSPRFALGVAVFFGGAAIAIGVYIARIAGGDATMKAISVWWIWPFVGVAAVGVILLFTGRRPPPPGPDITPLPRRRRFPTVDDLNRVLGRDTSKSSAETTPYAPTNND